MYRLKVITDKLNIRSSAVADATLANWIGDCNRDEYFFAEKKVKGALYEGVDDWYVDVNSCCYWAGGVAELPLPVSDTTILHFNTTAAFPTEPVEWNKRIKTLPAEIVFAGGDPVTIGVLDSGIEQHHLDLVDVICAMKDFTRSPFDCADKINHGSLIASLIAAKQYFPGKGVSGICNNASLVIAKVVYERNDPLDFISYAAGIAFAVDNGAQVINMSIGTGSRDNIPIVCEQIDRAVQQGVALVASTKQINFPVQELLQFPASHEHVIAVAAVTKQYYLSNQQHFPPGIILTPRLKVTGAANEESGFYKSDIGSSVGTAFITGFVALLIRAGKLNKKDKATILEELKKYQATPDTLFDNATNYIIQP